METTKGKPARICLCYSLIACFLQPFLPTIVILTVSGNSLTCTVVTFEKEYEGLFSGQVLTVVIRLYCIFIKCTFKTFVM